MPKEKLSEFIEGLRLLKQKVIWKYDGDAPENLPVNIIARKWIPQNDLLAHPSVVAFVTHGKTSS